ncbi:helix-turn-helix domain-containing protein [Roseivirga sp. E12]|uniref:helix-turn-helix domain-containing protein n=1 Tax=Roseivirga sp. E12 TaxID=2819237 RepID=UPI001ABC974D|nr:helix-turn-helix domain-containing protein [Roseivirga sp. E12]MBO3699592.1 helix-turn-helix domain-containing protein [Roseivirga sp. E12]
MSYVGQNIKRIRAVRKLSQANFAELFNLARPSVGAYEEGRSEPKIQTLIEIAHYFGLSIDVLLTKELTVNDLYSFNLVNQKLDALHQGVPSPKQTSKASLVLQSQHLNYIVNHQKRDFLESLPKCELPFLGKGVNRLFEMIGDHMVVDQQGLHHGDFLFCEKVDWDSIDQSHENSVLLAVTKEVIAVGRLEKFDTLELAADNPSFKPVSIDMESLIELWVVRGKLSTHLNSPKKIEEKVHSVEEQLKALMQRMENIEQKNQ